MFADEISLSSAEKKWILTRRVTRLADDKEVQIYPMGAERYLSSVLFGRENARYDLRADMVGKDVLVIPGYGNSGFLLAQSGAKSVTICDKDPVTIAWIKAFKKYYHFREQGGFVTYPSIGDLLTALTCWYPPILKLPFGRYAHAVLWAIHPNGLRRIYIHYLLTLVHHAMSLKHQGDYELKRTIHFQAGTLHQVIKKTYDTAFVPYLLGVQNGIELEEDIVRFVELLAPIIKGHILISPSHNSKEFLVMGKRYFVTTSCSSLQTIPGLQPFMKAEDRHWFRSQGLAILQGSLLTKPL